MGLPACQMRCTALKVMPTALAIMRPVVVAFGGSPQGNASTQAMVAGDNGALPDLRVLSRSNPSTPCSAKRRCQRLTDGRLAPLARCHIQHGQTLRRQQNDPGTLNMLLRTVAVLHNGGQTLAVCGGDDGNDGLCMHTESHKLTPIANPAFCSKHWHGSGSIEAVIFSVNKAAKSHC